VAANVARHVYAFDLDKARSLLQQAGVSGFELEAIYVGTNAMDTALAQIYQSDLANSASR